MAQLSSLTVNDTGSLTLPSGTTAQRPSNTSTIVQWSNTGTQSVSVLSGSATTTTTSWTCPAGVTSIEVLVVAGGGGGGNGLGSGAGAGGLIYNSTYSVTPTTTYSVTVGAGGLGATTANAGGAQGSNSVFDKLTAIGGGGGAGEGSTNGTTGGSGGGVSSGSGLAPLISTTLAGTAGQGHRGGAGFYDGTRFGYPQGSGGGAGGPGELSITGGYSKAGPGVLYNITGTPTYYAGGGGGSGYTNFGTTPAGPAPGGIGGGGAGGAAVSSGTGVAGTAGTNGTGGGGGGGGEGANGNQAGGNGGSGTVVIRYVTNNSLSAMGQTRFNSAASTVEVLDANNQWKVPLVNETPNPNGLILNLDASKYVSGSTWQDISGYNNHGTLNNTSYTSGTHGGYFTFNGTSSYVDFGSNYIFPGVTNQATTTEFTINTWVSWSVFGGVGNDELISWWATGFQTYLDGFLGTTTAGAIRFGDDIQAAGAFRFATKDIGKWFNVTAVKTADNAYVYINGQLAATKGSSLSWGFNAPPMIGRHPASTEYFNGKMGIMQIYNRALRADEVARNYNEYRARYQNSPAQAPYINLNKYSLPAENNIVFHLDVANPASYSGPGSTVIYDLAGRAHCTLVNTPTWTNDGGGSLIFNGSNQKGTFPNVTIPTTTEATGFIWFRTTSTSTYQNIWDGGDSGTGTRFYIVSGTLGGGFSHSNAITTTSFSANTWYCIAASNAGGQGRLYLNGILVGSNAYGMQVTTGLNLGEAGNQARLGQVDGDRATEYFTGQFGMMAFYNKELSHAEIMQIFQATRGRFGV
jgi:hypothetical protein